MKRAARAALAFAGAFSGVYLACCYLIPGLRIKLAADAGTYFSESIRHMAPYKSAAAVAAGLLAAGVAAALGAKREK
ncbi:hypothetical protein [Feifania hominis]|uniref:Uncharacterized protein n=1 Tax=Feifania hominis TaxID=2763660 RepID=A0A926HUW3_9FIRM|nr:hypothetical protein [Feifania hominis]MBC8536718.1 hypothetical protein [Feifania hominis]